MPAPLLRRAIPALMLFAGPLQAQGLPGDPLAGQRLAREWCGECHLAAPGAASDAVPSFRAIAARPGTTAATLRAALQAPHAPMPPLGLSRAQIDDLVAFILSPP
ncbi:c-type cytochrome [Falsiroseomonas tokyonensis]|uniref:C-type cytochrome n=1 Tax=Falsiroseomonas tokyonensis TaxID=430521 RepID=A0ABV7C436_9PROT|nr:cytochrome c [Falsiroseomonas tokyonensis]MBU8541181.1 cytochrome c [Falsiroseomonas tokyonensis]